MKKMIVLCSVIAVAVFAQAPKGGGPPGERKKGGFRNLAELIKPLEESGFQSMFDGRTLSGWEGDSNFWRVEGGAIVGQTTAEKQPKQNTFLIWRGGRPGDFELKLDYRMTGNNSGIQYRSEELPDIKFALKGYQADIDGQQTFTGQVYEERGRGFLALRGQVSYIGDGQKPGLIGTLGDSDELKALIKTDDWNSLHIIAQGDKIIQILNGRAMSVVIDQDKGGRKLDGVIGIQCHVGPPMKIEVKNIRIKK